MGFRLLICGPLTYVTKLYYCCYLLPRSPNLSECFIGILLIISFIYFIDTNFLDVSHICDIYEEKTIRLLLLLFWSSQMIYGTLYKFF